MGQGKEALGVATPTLGQGGLAKPKKRLNEKTGNAKDRKRAAKTWKA